MNEGIDYIVGWVDRWKDSSLKMIHSKGRKMLVELFTLQPMSLCFKILAEEQERRGQVQKT